MTVSTDGILCFGVIVGEDAPFGDYDIEEWWTTVRGFSPTKEIYDKDGEYINGIEPSEDDLDPYWDERQKFFEQNPIPVDFVNYCSNDYPMWIFATPSSVRTANRGYPKMFNPDDLVVDEDELIALYEFCKEFEIEYDTPKWYLCSYWG